MENIEYTITPKRNLLKIDFKEILQYKDLLSALVTRNIKVRYKQTILGVAWAIFQPFITMIVFSLLFGRVSKFSEGEIPYPIFLYSGLIFWNYFSTSLTSASNSMVNERHIISKVYFPRIILPLSSIITPIVDFLFALLMLVFLGIFFKVEYNLITLVLTPVLLAMTAFTSFGLGLSLSAINVKYRDVRYILPFFIQLIMYISPVIYPVTIIPDQFKWIMYLNPLTAILNSARAIITGGQLVEPINLLISFGVSIFLFLIGILIFNKTERYFSDIV